MFPSWENKNRISLKFISILKSKHQKYQNIKISKKKKKKKKKKTSSKSRLRVGREASTPPHFKRISLIRGIRNSGDAIACFLKEGGKERKGEV